MLIDDYDIDEKQDVAIITPAESPEEVEADPPADDCKFCFVNSFIKAYRLYCTDEAIKARFLPLLADQDAESEGYHTWNIENYRSLSKKEHGPIFQVGGNPW
jgi:ubiquitin carboxyl-terminal hydrolase 7